MNSENFRCNCPITSALDVVGDKWSLVIIKQMLLQDCLTFKDFSESTEAIAPNILSARLKTLEKLKFIEKKKIPQNKKTLAISAERSSVCTLDIFFLGFTSELPNSDLKDFISKEGSIACISFVF